MINEPANRLGYSFTDYFEAFQNHFTAQGIPELKTREEHRAVLRRSMYAVDPQKFESFYHIYSGTNLLAGFQIQYIKALYFILDVRKGEFLLLVGDITLDVVSPKDLEEFTPSELVKKVIAFQQGLIELDKEKQLVRKALGADKKVTKNSQWFLRSGARRYPGI